MDNLKTTMLNALNPGIMPKMARIYAGMQLATQMIADLPSADSRMILAEYQLAPIRRGNLIHAARSQLGSQLSISAWAPPKLASPLARAASCVMSGRIYYYQTERKKSWPAIARQTRDRVTSRDPPGRSGSGETFGCLPVRKPCVSATEEGAPAQH